MSNKDIMNHRKLNNGVQKIIRISEDYRRLCSFIEFLSDQQQQGGITKSPLFFDKVIEYSMNNLITNGFHYHVKKIKEKREPKGFHMSEYNAEKFETLYNAFQIIYDEKYGEDLTKGEFMEILMFIYAKDHQIDNKKIEYITGKSITWSIEEV